MITQSQIQIEYPDFYEYMMTDANHHDRAIIDQLEENFVLLQYNSSQVSRKTKNGYFLLPTPWLLNVFTRYFASFSEFSLKSIAQRIVEVKPSDTLLERYIAALASIFLEGYDYSGVDEKVALIIKACQKANTSTCMAAVGFMSFLSGYSADSFPPVTPELEEDSNEVLTSVTEATMAVFMQEVDYLTNFIKNLTNSAKSETSEDYWGEPAN